MSQMWIIFNRELRARVANRAFIVGTFLFPLIMIAIIALPVVVGGGAAQRTLALVDEAPDGIADRFAEVLRDNRAGDSANSYQIERLKGPLSRHESELNRRVLARQLDGYVVLPSDVTASNRIAYRARNLSSLVVIRDLQLAANRAVQSQRLRESGIDPATLSSLIRSVRIDSGQVAKDKNGKGSATAAFALAYGVAFLVYFTIISQGIGLLRSVLEEKNNRISEVMVSSVRPGYLMAGKILGVGSASLLQVSIWIAMVATGASFLSSRGIVPPEIVDALSVAPGTLVAFFLFFVFGFLLYAALCAALGSMVNSEQEAQSIQSLVLLPLIVPLIFTRAITNDPLGEMATWLGMIPFTAPIAMPLRMASETLSRWEVATSLGLLIVAMLAVTWVAGRIYRIGILSTGKKPTMAELIKWIRAS